MKKFGLFFCLSALLALAACNSDDTDDAVTDVQLAKPEVAISTITESMFKVVWDAVPNAEGYKYQLAQESETGEEIPVIAEQTTSATALSFDNLEQETKYILRVKAFATNGLADSEYCKIFATTLAEIREPLTFSSITVGEITYESAKVELVPDALDLYYFTVMENSAYEGKSESEIVAALQSNITASSLVSGKQTKTFNGLKAETNYQVVAFGWDADSKKLTSKISNQPFKTVADTRMSIKITVGTPTDQNVSITFTPSDSAAPYFADVVESTEVAGKGELEIVALLQSKYGKEMTDIMHTGNYSNNYAIESGKSYVAVAFAYDTTTSELTSAMASESFSAGLADGNSIFTITVSNVAKTSADVDVQTSDAEMYYFLAAYQTSLESQTGGIEKMAESIVEMLNEYCAEEGFDAVAQNILYKGNTNGAFSTLNPNTEYKVYVLGVAKESEKSLKAVTSMATSDAFTTLADNAKYPAVSFKYEVLDGGLIDPQFAGTTVLYLTFMPNKLCANYLFKYYSDAEDLSDSQIIAALKSNGLDQSETVQNEYGVAFGPDQLGRVTIGAVGIDADGKTGNLSRITIDLKIGEEGTVEGDGETAPEESVSSEDYKKYLGDWTVTSTSSVISKQPITFDITVNEGIPDMSYNVIGWSTSLLRKEQPTSWTYDAEYKAFTIDALKIMTFDHDEYGTCTLEYQPICYLQGDKTYDYVRFQDMTSLFAGMAVDENQVIVMGDEGVDVGLDQLIDFVGMEFCAFSTQYLLTYPAAEGYTQGDYPIGPYTLTKKTSSSTASTIKTRTNRALESMPVANTTTKVQMSSILGDSKYMMPETLFKALKAKIEKRTDLQGKSLDLSNEQIMKLQFKVAGQKVNAR